MKLCVKKIYCPDCQRLVRGREQKVNDNTGVSCSRCGKLIWVRNGIGWRYIREVE